MQYCAPNDLSRAITSEGDIFFGSQTKMNSPVIIVLERAFENLNVYICIIHSHNQING